MLPGITFSDLFVHDKSYTSETSEKAASVIEITDQNDVHCCSPQDKNLKELDVQLTLLRSPHEAYSKSNNTTPDDLLLQTKSEYHSSSLTSPQENNFINKISKDDSSSVRTGYSSPPKTEHCSIPSPVQFDNKIVIREFEGRGKKGRRLTFLMQEIPDVLCKGQGDAFVRETQKICGNDICSEDESSMDEAWGPKEIEDDIIPLNKNFSDELDEHLILELLAINDETDRLHELDTLEDDKNNQNVKSTVLPSLSTENDKELQTSFSHLSVEIKRMNSSQLLQWYIGIRESYKKGVKVIKVTKGGKKIVRSLKVDEKFIYLSKGPFERRCHLSWIRNVRLGFSSENFRNLLHVSPEYSLVPPPESCISIELPNQTVSIILPSEEARNECLLLFRVLIREAKRRYKKDNNSQHICNEDAVNSNL